MEMGLSEGRKGQGGKRRAGGRKGGRGGKVLVAGNLKKLAAPPPRQSCPPGRDRTCDLGIYSPSLHH